MRPIFALLLLVLSVGCINDAHPPLAVIKADDSVAAESWTECVAACRTCDVAARRECAPVIMPEWSGTLIVGRENCSGCKVAIGYVRKAMADDLNWLKSVRYVDVNEEKQLAKRLGIDPGKGPFPQFVRLEFGDEVDRWEYENPDEGEYLPTYAEFVAFCKGEHESAALVTEPDHAVSAVLRDVVPVEVRQPGHGQGTNGELYRTVYYPATTGGPLWTYNGGSHTNEELRQHLARTHGIPMSKSAGYSRSELIRLHSLAHNTGNRMTTRTRTVRYTRSSGCPGGRCPS